MSLQNLGYVCERNKRGHMVSEETIKWVLYIAIAIAAGVSIKMIISRFVS